MSPQVNLTADIPSCLACLTLWPLRRYQRGSCWCSCAPCWGSRWWRTEMVRPLGTTGSSSVPVLDWSVWLNWTAGPGEAQKVSNETESWALLTPSVQTTCEKRSGFTKYIYVSVLLCPFLYQFTAERKGKNAWGKKRQEDDCFYAFVGFLWLSAMRHSNATFFAPPAVNISKTACTKSVFG